MPKYHSDDSVLATPIASLLACLPHACLADGVRMPKLDTETASLALSTLLALAWACSS